MKENKIDLAAKALLGVLLGLFALLCGCSETTPNGNAPTNLSTPKSPVDNGPKREVTFFAVGDIMLSRGVAGVINRAGTDRPFALCKDELLKTDFNFGNFESPVSGNDSRVGKGLVFNTRVKDVAAIINSHFKVVNLANNHMFDQGLAGMRNTLKVMNDREIVNVGVGEDQTEAWLPKYLTVNGIKIAFIGASFSSVNDLGKTRNPQVARVEDLDRLQAAVAAAKLNSDFILVTMHAGVEYTRQPNKLQVDFARAAIDAGADIVIGAHPHWIQTTEQYKGRWIFYSLGNFIFDQRDPETHRGLTLRIKLAAPSAQKPNGGANVEKIELLPVIIETVGVPRFANAAETQSILRSIGVDNAVITPSSMAK